MAKKYYLGERAADALSEIIPYIDRQMRSKKFGKTVGTPLFGGKAFLAKITSEGPNEEVDFTDPRYWVREVIITNDDNDYTTIPTFAYPEKPEGISIAQWTQVTHWVAATNIPEIADGSHFQLTNDSIYVIVHVNSDQGYLPRYYFYQEQLASFIAMVTNTGPAGQADYADQRYWIIERKIINSGQPNTTKLIFADVINPIWATATNLAEVRMESHDFPTGHIVRVFKLWDQTPIVRYVFTSLPIAID